MKTVYVIPREGVKVRAEHGKAHIPAGGENMMLTTYIQRRISDGDLVVRADKETAGDKPGKPLNQKKG